VHTKSLSTVYSIAVQSAKRSRSNEGIEIAFNYHQKLCAFRQETHLKVATECIVREIGTGNQRKIVDDCDLGVELPRPARLI
jgi:hypothetical protein